MKLTDEELIKFLKEVFGDEFQSEFSNYHNGEARIARDGVFVLLGGNNSDDFYKVPIHLDRLREAIRRYGVR